MPNMVDPAEDYDPFSPAAMRDPLPFYARLRRHRPVLYLPAYDAWVLTRFQHIFDALSITDNSLLQSEGSLPTPEALRQHNAGPPALPGFEPFVLSQRYGMPVHGQIRRAHTRPLLPGAVNRLRADVRERAHARLDELLPQGRFDLTRDYAGIVASGTIMRLMGMPLDLAAPSLDLVNGGSLADEEQGGVDTAASAAKCVELYRPFVARRFEEGADGSLPMIDGLISYRHEGRQLSVTEAATQLVCAFIGGIESAPKIAAHGLMELANHQDQLAAVRRDYGAHIPLVAEEIIRYCAPAQWFVRTVHKPVEIGGQAIDPGQRIFAVIASANRDEREYDDPDRFIWNRRIPRTLAFGYGMHVCIGVHLARMEVQEMVRAFIERVDEYHVDMEAARRPPSSFQWGWNHLPVIIDRVATH